MTALDGQLPELPDDVGSETLDTAAPEDRLTVDLDGYEGPLDMLLDLARRQKVDLRRISVLALADQYIVFIEGAKAHRIDLAASYLVMAAWLVYLKSRLLLPQPEGDPDTPSGEELAARLAHRLARLDAMRRMGEGLMARDRLGRDRFVRGAPEAVTVEQQIRWQATLADLLGAYARVAAREEYRPLHLDAERPMTVAIEDALAWMREMLGDVPRWAELSAFLPERWIVRPETVRSAVASSFVAALELARDGALELRQERPFAPLYLRRIQEEAA